MFHRSLSSKTFFKSEDTDSSFFKWIVWFVNDFSTRVTLWIFFFWTQDATFLIIIGIIADATIEFSLIYVKVTRRFFLPIYTITLAIVIVQKERTNNFFINRDWTVIDRKIIEELLSSYLLWNWDRTSHQSRCWIFIFLNTFMMTISISESVWYNIRMWTFSTSSSRKRILICFSKVLMIHIESIDKLHSSLPGETSWITDIGSSVSKLISSV